MANNIYGVQKIKEPEVRDGLDIAGSVTGNVAKAAQMGAKFGPWGAVGAGTIAGVASLADQVKKQNAEKLKLRDAKNQNEFTDNLEGRAFREDTMVSAQAKYGMSSKNKYQNAEIEGDGSGSSKSGIGEIHTDKNYNIKNVAKGAAKHKDGGYKINNLEKEDVIFPTQNNKQEYDKVLNLVNRWKLKRDPRAKIELDAMRNKLPTDQDYGYDKKFKKGKGESNFGYMDSKTQLSKIVEKGGAKYSRRQLRKMSEKEAEKAVMEIKENDSKFEENYPDVFEEMTASAEEKRLDAEFQKEQEFLNSNVVAPDKESELEMVDDNPFKKYDEARDIPILDKYSDIYSDKQNQIVKPLPKSESNKFLEPGDFEKTTYKDAGKKLYEEQLEEIEEEDIVDPAAVERPSTKEIMNKGADLLEKRNKENPMPERSLNYLSPDITNNTDNTEDINTTNNTDNTNNTNNTNTTDNTDNTNTNTNTNTNPYEKYQREAWEDINTIKDRDNPLKYSSMINKSIQGNKPIDEVERRFLNPEKYKYEDMSAKDRQTNVEQRNYQNLSMRGKGLTAAQKQSYGAQNNAQYYSNAEKINATENKKRADIGNLNVDLNNKTQQSNLTLANKYDEFDDMARGSQQKYIDESFRDLSENARLNEEKKYMMDLDRKKMKMDMAKVGLAGSQDYDYDPKNPFFLKQKKQKKKKKKTGEDN